MNIHLGRLRPAILLGALLSLTLAWAGSPNLLLIVADDLGYADVGFHGLREAATPNLDRLARESVRFTQAYVSAPVCGPSRAGLITGRHGQRQGFEYNYDPRERNGLDRRAVTIADRLRAAGYATALVGKWHLGTQPEHHPLNRGFDRFFGFLGGGHDYFEYDPSAPATSYRSVLERDGTRLQELSGNVTDLLVAEAETFLLQPRAQPFFLYLSLNAPHTPLQPKPAHLAQLAAVDDPIRRKYLGLVLDLDEAVGRTLAALDRSGVAGNTLVVFLSDNGGVTDARSHASNAPLRNQKGSLWEGGIRVPMLWRWPAQLDGGRDYPLPVSALDLAPTFLALAGKPLTADQTDGVDLMPYLRGGREGRPHEAMFWRFDFKGRRRAVRDGDWKLHVFSDAYGNDEQAWLVDLAADPAESRNLAPIEPERVARMRDRLTAWEREMSAPAWPVPTMTNLPLRSRNGASFVVR